MAEEKKKKVKNLQFLKDANRASVIKELALKMHKAGLNYLIV